MIQETRKERARAELIKNHTCDKEGIWIVKGEDDNADFGGSHYMPTLGYFKGRYIDVVSLAVELKRFFTWGRGGSIDLIEVQTVDQNAILELQNAVNELKELDAKRIKLEHTIKSMGG